jgi:hypothetical protein
MPAGLADGLALCVPQSASRGSPRNSPQRLGFPVPRIGLPGDSAYVREHGTATDVAVRRRRPRAAGSIASEGHAPGVPGSVGDQSSVPSGNEPAGAVEDRARRGGPSVETLARLAAVGGESSCLALVVLCEVAEIDLKSHLSGIQRNVWSSQRRNLALHVVEDRTLRPHKALLVAAGGFRPPVVGARWFGQQAGGWPIW